VVGKAVVWYSVSLWTWRSWIRTLVSAIFTVNVQSGLEAHLASCSMNIGSLYRW